MYMTIEEFKELENKVEILLLSSYEKGGDELKDLARMYESGTFVEIKRDLIKAYEYYEEAAESGDVYSMRTLGNAYADGFNHLEKNIETAIEWFQKAADLDDSYSKKRLEKLKENKNDNS